MWRRAVCAALVVVAACADEGTPTPSQPSETSQLSQPLELTDIVGFNAVTVAGLNADDTALFTVFVDLSERDGPVDAVYELPSEDLRVTLARGTNLDVLVASDVIYEPYTQSESVSAISGTVRVTLSWPVRQCDAVGTVTISDVVMEDGTTIAPFEFRGDSFDCWV